MQYTIRTRRGTAYVYFRATPLSALECVIVMHKSQFSGEYRAYNNVKYTEPFRTQRKSARAAALAAVDHFGFPSE